MAEETKHTPVVEEEVVIAPVAESIVALPVIEKKATEPVETEKHTEEAAEEEGDNKVTESASFKEESNVVADLPNPQQKALDEFKKLVKSALEKHEFTAPVKEEVVVEPEAVAQVEEKKEPEEPVVESKPEEEVKEQDKKEPEAEAEAEKVEEVEEKTTPPPAEPEKEIPSPSEPEGVVEKIEKKVVEFAEEIKETIVEWIIFIISYCWEKKKKKTPRNVQWKLCLQDFGPESFYYIVNEFFYDYHTLLIQLCLKRQI